jgi:broad specificity phosphatase PhoE
VLILVRHGRTQSNASGLLQGRVDNPLDDVGLWQVTQVAAAIGPVDQVITSSLVRARQTGEMFDAPSVIDDRWIELDYGEFDGMPLTDVPREAWVKWRSDPTFAPPGGESMVDMDARVRDAAVDALEMARESTVVVVSHVSPIKAAVAWALGADVSLSSRLQLDQAAVCRIMPGQNGAVLRSFNEILYGK